MSDGIRGYDAWKLATPPEYEELDRDDAGEGNYCDDCDREIGPGEELCLDCCRYWEHVDAKIDEWKEGGR